MRYGLSFGGLPYSPTQHNRHTMQRTFPDMEASKYSQAVSKPPVESPYLASTSTLAASSDPKDVMDICCVVCDAYGIPYERSGFILTGVVYLPDCGACGFGATLWSTAADGLLVEISRLKGPMTVVSKLFGVFEAALKETHMYTAWYALPQVLHLMPPPLITYDDDAVMVSPLTPEQTEQLLRPLVELMRHEYSDVVLNGVNCVFSLSAKRPNLHTMLNYEALLPAVLHVLYTALLPDARVAAALVLCALLEEDAPRVCAAMKWTDYAQITQAATDVPSGCLEDRYRAKVCVRALARIKL